MPASPRMKNEARMKMRENYVKYSQLYENIVITLTLIIGLSCPAFIHHNRNIMWVPAIYTLNTYMPVIVTTLGIEHVIRKLSALSNDTHQTTVVLKSGSEN